uniref:Uncharacterized protein n=1 Tax=Hemiselmis andersenii TaxID=464988 RepID=A0A6T8PEI9_HEMAN|mmetsp:Transcript_17083/g.39383  ORF Transcript_17083/g.39383 Transcript_17083/m.39383 type:complete len:120 (+) Transcript_17083:127-486(+)
MCRLHTLNLSGCQAGDSIAPLAVLLKSNRSSSCLTNLKLSNNSIADAGASHLAAALQHNYTLKQLDLSGNMIETAGARKLADMRRSNTSLLSLNMNASGCSCGRSQGSALPVFDGGRAW